MNNDKLQRWALVAEIIGGVAVIFGLLFVGLEIRQSSEETALNTRAIEVNAYQDLISQIMEINFNEMNNPQLLELTERDRKGERIDDTLYRLHVLNVFRHGDMAFHQYTNGLIDQARLDSTLGIVRALLIRSPTAREIWSTRTVFLPEYTSYVDNLVESFEQIN